MNTINVVAAVITFRDKFLCVQRGLNKYDYIAYKFEFPGGKIEPDEQPEKALIREICEELQKEILVNRKFITVDHQYLDFRIIMHSYLCFADDDSIKLTEHICYKWLTISEMESLDWAAADIPIVQNLMRLYAQNECERK